MIVNVIGDCDKRPVIYTLMKVFQTLGDVLFVTNNSFFRRLSNTGDSGGHFQNVMIAFTNGGVGDFFDEFRYDYEDFSYVILDNVVEAEANLTIHVYSMLDSETTKDTLEYMEDVVELGLWNNKSIGQAYVACEKFEAFGVMLPMPIGIVQPIAQLIAAPLKASVDNITKIAMTVPHGSETLKAQPRKAPKGAPKSGGISLFKKGGK